MQERRLLKLTILSFMIYICFSQPLECAECVYVELIENCEICYEGCQNSMQMKKCLYTYCSRYSYYGDEPYCVDYDTVYLSEETCLQYCCSPQLEDTQFTLQNVDRCVEINQVTWGIIVGIVIAIFVVIGIIIYCCLWGEGVREKIKDFFSKCFGSSGQITNQSSFKQKQTIEMGNSDCGFKNSKIVWYENKVNNKDVLPTTIKRCSCCLKIGGGVQSSCDHLYHVECLQQVGNICLSCQQNIWPIKYQCVKCESKYITLSVEYADKILQVLKTKQFAVCLSCSDQ